MNISNTLKSLISKRSYDSKALKTKDQFIIKSPEELNNLPMYDAVVYSFNAFSHAMELGMTPNMLLWLSTDKDGQIHCCVAGAMYALWGYKNFDDDVYDMEDNPTKKSILQLRSLVNALRMGCINQNLHNLIGEFGDIEVATYYENPIKWEQDIHTKVLPAFKKYLIENNVYHVTLFEMYKLITKQNNA